MGGYESDEGYSSTTSEEDEVDIHFLAREGTIQDIDWALFKDRNRLLNLKELRTGYSCLHCACEVGRIDVVAHLIKKGAILDFRDLKFRTPLMTASAKGLTDVARLLLEKGADIKCKDRECWTALHHAVCESHVDTCVMLIKRGVDLSAEEARFGRTALHFCAELGLHELADNLIVRGSDMYGSGDSIYTKTPLHLSCVNGHTNVTDVLIKRGADLETTCGFLDMTALHCACEHGHLGCVQRLIEAGADMSAIGFTFNGATPLHLSCIKGHVEISRYLCNKGASLTMQGKFTTEGTPLHLAVQHGQSDCVAVLVDNGADIEMKDLNGNTAMHTACKYSQFDVALQLINYGADLTAIAGNARFPLELIPSHESYKREELRLAGLNYDAEMERKAAEVAKAIADAEAAAAAKKAAEEEAARRLELLRREQEKRVARFSALLMACCNISGELSALTDIITEYPDLDINMELETERGSRAIVRAAFNGFNVVVEALLRWKGIDMNVQERDGNTALHMAASRGKLQHKLIVEMLLFAGVRTGIPNRAGQLASTIGATPYLCEVIRDPRLLHPSLASMTAVAATTIKARNKVEKESLEAKVGLVGFNYLEQDSVSLGASTVVSHPVGGLVDPAQGVLLNPGGSTNYAPGVASGASVALSLGASQLFNRDGTPASAEPGRREAVKLDGTTPYTTFGPGSLEDFTTGIDTMTGKPWVVKDVDPLQGVRPTSPLAIPTGGDDASVGGLSVDSRMGDPMSLPLLKGATGSSMSISSPQPHAGTKQVRARASSSFGSERFGPPPRKYEPSRADLFFLRYQTQHNSVVTSSLVAPLPDNVKRERSLMSVTQETSVVSFGEEKAVPLGDGDFHPEGGNKHSLFTENGEGVSLQGATRFPLQASHTPSAFDTTDEWESVKDYLWLLGYPYSKTFIAHQQQERQQQLAQRRGMTPHRASTNNLWAGAAEEQHGELSASATAITDPRATLHSLAILMNDTQETFADPLTGGFHIDFDASGSLAKDELSKLSKHKEGGDVKLKYFALEFVKKSINLYIPKGMEDPYSRGVIGGVKAILKAQLQGLLASGRISDDVEHLLLKLLELSEAKGLQLVVSHELQEEMSGMGAEDKAGAEYNQPPGGTVKYTPRQRRVMVDAMFELALVYKTRAERDFPTDNIRTRFWVHEARDGKFSETIKYDLAFDLMLWLKDLHLHVYYEHFDDLGFRLLTDFNELSLEDCKEYFPFLKIGDAVRLSKAIKLLGPDSVAAYRVRAEKKEVGVPLLPPIPTK